MVLQEVIGVRRSVKNIEAGSSWKTLEGIYQNISRYISEDSNLHGHCHGSRKSHNQTIVHIGDPFTCMICTSGL
jgi:hypothetical protein